MSERVVICFRWADLSVGASEYLNHAQALLVQASGAGAKLSIVGVGQLAFELSALQLGDALRLAAQVHQEGKRWAVGIARGEVERTAAPSGVALSYGPALIHAQEFALCAVVGETRVSAFTSESQEQLRQFRAAQGAPGSQGAISQCQAALAHAVALGSAGHLVAALIEALTALARAREAENLKAERACLSFLAQLNRTAGSTQAAQIWSSRASALLS